MQVTLRLMGCEVIFLELTTDPEPAETEGTELAGGTLVAERVAAEGCDTVMGFTNGRECGDE